MVIAVFLIGLLIVGLTGASTSMSFVWPGYLVIGLAGVLSIVTLFRTTYFKIPKWCFGSIFILLAYVLARASDSPVIYFSREDSSLLVVCFLCYGIFIGLFTDARSRKFLFWGVVALVMINLALAGWQLLVSPVQWIFPGYERTFSHRIGGVFNHPDHFACFLAASMPLLLSVACFGKYPRAIRVGLTGLSVVAAVAIVVSKSAVGLFSMSFGVTVFFLLSLVLVWKNLNLKVKKFIVIGMLVGGIVICGVAISKKSGVARAIDSQLLTKEGVIHLPMVWSAAREQFSVSPFIGTGSRTFYYYSRRYRPVKAGGANVEAEFAHNEFIQMAADYGLIGLGLIAAVLLLHFQNGMRFVQAYIGYRPISGLPIPRSDHLALVLGAVGGLTVIGTQSMFDFVMHVPVIAVFAALFLAVLACPDPMSRVHEPIKESYLPGGSFLFVTRAISFGSGIALVLLGFVFTQSEWHFEKARLAFRNSTQSYQLFRHLQSARRLDPGNPYIYSLSGHAHVASIEPDTTGPARIAALERAGNYFSAARQLYPYDIFAAIGHSSVLDALGRKDRAREVLRDAREWAPSYGCLMMAEAEHFLRQGKMVQAEESYLAARNAAVFRSEEAADRGLKMIGEWRKIAAVSEAPESSDEEVPASLKIRDAKVESILLGGKSEKQE